MSVAADVEAGIEKTALALAVLATGYGCGLVSADLYRSSNGCFVDREAAVVLVEAGDNGKLVAVVEAVPAEGNSYSVRNFPTQELHRLIQMVTAVAFDTRSVAWRPAVAPDWDSFVLGFAEAVALGLARIVGALGSFGSFVDVVEWKVSSACSPVWS